MSSRKEYKLNSNATVYIRKYEPFLSLKILGDLQTKFLGPMASFMESQDASQSKDLQMKYIMDGLERISKSLDGNSLVLMARQVLDPEYISVSIGNSPAEKMTENMLNRAAENVGEVISLIVEVLRENYSEVFTKGLARIGPGQLNMARQ